MIILGDDNLKSGKTIYGRYFTNAASAINKIVDKINNPEE